MLSKHNAISQFSSADGSRTDVRKVVVRVKDYTYPNSQCRNWPRYHMK